MKRSGVKEILAKSEVLMVELPSDCNRMDPIQKIFASIAERKERLQTRRPLPETALAELQRYYDIEVTYTSNAIEGNTLTRVETSLVIEKGITIGGKPLKDHLEAIDHYHALRWVRELAHVSTPITESEIRNLHRLVLQRSAPEIAGQYADAARFTITETGRYIFPPPVEIPALMGDFAAWLRTAANTPETAFTTHLRFVAIHPFNDGNGRTGRLLMNLVLLRGGYPPIAIRPEDRLQYIRGLQEQQAGLGTERLDLLHYRRLDATLSEYLNALDG